MPVRVINVTDASVNEFPGGFPAVPVRPKNHSEPAKSTRGRPRDPNLAQQRKEQILTVTTHHFARFGYQDTDLQVIADELGIGKGTIYRYFPTKETLFRAALDRGLAGLKELIDQKIPPGSDPLAGFASAIEAYLGFFREQPELVELFLIERAVFPGRSKPAYFIQREQNSARWSEVFRHLIRQGRVRPGNIDGVLNAIGDLLYGTMFANHLAGRDVSPKEQARDILDLVFHGILGPDARDEFPEAHKEARRKTGRKR